MYLFLFKSILAHFIYLLNYVSLSICLFIAFVTISMKNFSPWFGDATTDRKQRERNSETKVKRSGRKLRIGIEKNDRRRRMNVRGGEERDSSLLVPRASKRTLLVETMRTFPLPRPKCSFPFPTCLFFPSLALLAHRCRPGLILLSLVISVFSRACILPSSYTYVRRLSDRSSSRFSSSRIYSFRDGGIRFTKRPDLHVRRANRIN